MEKFKKTVKSFSKNPIDYTLVIIILLLLSLGLIMVLSASSPTALSEKGKSYSYFVRQLFFAIMGLIAMFIISKIDYKIYKRFYKIGYIASIILLFLVLIIGRKVNGATRWIYVTSSLSFQPSELVKFLMIIFYATILTKNKDELGLFKKGFIKHVLYLAPIAILLLLEPHMSVTLVIVGISIIMMILAGCKLSQMFFCRSLYRFARSCSIDFKSRI